MLGFRTASCSKTRGKLPKVALSRGFLHMPISIQDIQRIAHLARIEITSAEAQDVQRKLDGIFELINEMRAVDTTGIVPMSHAQEVTAPLRDDHVSEPDRHALYQSVAPAVHDGLYLVPKVIE